MIGIDLKELNRIKKDQYGRISGIMAIDKPEGVFSHDVVDIVRKRLDTRKVGHAGTLDPFASGLLIMLVGSDTKKSQLLLNMDKTYECSVVLGIGTDSFDIDGNLIYDKKFRLDKDQLKKVIEKFNEEYIQYVPIFSSVKVSGMKLRELARSSSNIEYRDSSEGKIVEFILKDNSNKKFLKKSENGKVQILLPSKKVKVSIELLKTRIIKKDDIGLQGLKESSYSILDLKVDCSKGTYIRSLAHDIALELASDAFLLSLRRTNIDTINISDAISIEDIPEIR